MKHRFANFLACRGTERLARCFLFFSGLDRIVRGVGARGVSHELFTQLLRREGTGISIGLRLAHDVLEPRSLRHRGTLREVIGL